MLKQVIAARTRSALGTALVAWIMLSTHSAAGADHMVTVAIKVTSRGLNLNQSADARTFYIRLENAAWIACTRANRVDLVPEDYLRGCYEKALGDAIRSVKAPMVNRIYMATHTLEQAAEHAIDLPTQLALAPSK